MTCELFLSVCCPFCSSLVTLRKAVVRIFGFPDIAIPPGMWEGMGEYDASTILPIIEDVLPKIRADRAWPWVARAIYVYETEVSTSAWYNASEPNADELGRRIAKQAGALSKSLTDLTWLTMRSPAEVGEENIGTAIRLSGALKTCFEREANNVVTALHRGLSPRTPKSANSCDSSPNLFESLVKVSKTFTTLSDNVASGRMRDASDKHLALLVAELGDFWWRATDKEPSASDPDRKDGKLGPFMLLVNGCLTLAGCSNVTPKKVRRALRRHSKEGVIRVQS